ncbi:Rib/alpha-like domain-containing protein [Staphylococcus hominis]|uniref:Rib/alpha-like domain-containing protein n=1 Tax=Staphylococcus hominis TaxID=1290 RepID=UPI000D5619BD|nr:Rib/alpha-like domain-containing protein [Staphylococcus hominis]
MLLKRNHTNQQQTRTPTITVDDPSTLPDGNTPGTVDVPVTVTYPDGTEDHVTVPVTTNEQADNDAYQPTTDEVTKDYGTPTTEEDVTGAVRRRDRSSYSTRLSK